MSDMTRKIFRFAKVVTAATGIVALSAVVASGVAVSTVGAGIKEAKSAVEKAVKKDTEETKAAAEVSVVEQ